MSFNFQSGSDVRVLTQDYAGYQSTSVSAPAGTTTFDVPAGKTWTIIYAQAGVRAGLMSYVTATIGGVSVALTDQNTAFPLSTNKGIWILQAGDQVQILRDGLFTYKEDSV